jgi:photosynthetic reaction center cytochrome c subunit
MKIAAWLIGAILAALTAFMLLTAGWERPPIDTEQSGYRGTGMAEVINPRKEAALRQSQLPQIPEPAPLPPDAGPRAGDVYQNVQVLGDLSVARFTRLMQGITEWVSPEQGCAYCHNLDNLAEDSVYTKIVSRRMLEMTQNINGNWQDHVKQTGVTCYTCHRGKNVPEYGWFNSDPEAEPVAGMAGWRNGQNRASPEVGLASLPEDPFGPYLDGNEEIRVVGDTALPDGDGSASIQATEWSYALMIHMSESLGVNCTYCHNSRGFSVWNESTPQRAQSWYGIEMARALNTEYVAPLSSVLPPERLGPTGEGQKVNCTTCHQGVNKPLYGEQMVDAYPSLKSPSASTVSGSETAPQAPAEQQSLPVALEDQEGAAEPPADPATMD